MSKAYKEISPLDILLPTSIFFPSPTFPTYNHHPQSSPTIITHNHHPRSLYKVITYDHHLQSSSAIIIHDHHLQSLSTVIIFDDYHPRSSPTIKIHNHPFNAHLYHFISFSSLHTLFLKQLLNHSYSCLCFYYFNQNH